MRTYAQVRLGGDNTSKNEEKMLRGRLVVLALELAPEKGHKEEALPWYNNEA